MTLIDLVCPDCGAKLRINEKLTHATCNYCGHNIVIKNDQQDGHQFGFDFERGRIQAQSVTNAELASRIQKLLPVLPKVQKYQEKLNSLTLQSQELEVLYGHHITYYFRARCCWSIFDVIFLARSFAGKKTIREYK